MHHDRTSWLLMDLTYHYKQPASLINFNCRGGTGRGTTRRPKTTSLCSVYAPQCHV